MQADAQQADPLLLELAELADTTSKSTFASKLVCSECLGDDTAEACLDGKCNKCGFGRLWSQGLRPKVMVLDKGGKTEAVLDRCIHACMHTLIGTACMHTLVGTACMHTLVGTACMHTLVGTAWMRVCIL